MPVKNRIAELVSDITEWRQDIHAHPELLFDTVRTGQFVADKLKEFGCDEVVTGIAGTGVVGIIKGRTDTAGRVVGLRADMDALPIEEETGVEYASTNPGVMHACGHDGHTAMLLGAARYMAETRNFDGSVAVIFQPAEEGGGGGRVMCEEGMMERFNIQEVYGMHNWPGQEVGKFAIRLGPFFAAADQFEIQVSGMGGHAAKPHESIDSTVIAAHLVTALQTIASRNADPVEQIVLSVTSFRTATDAFNVIPDKVKLKGTLRTLTPEMRALGEKRLKEISAGIAATFGAQVEVNFIPGYPPMVNHEQETRYAIEAATKVSGSCADAPLVMGGEDFAYMLEARPGAYVLVGNGDSAMIHHPKYNFNDETIPAGSSWYIEMTESRMPVA
ncbi:M20 aminoacylase family protein [Granulosicoccus antarcticus]|uniref:Putative hydrolase YxeP n=1 Tax=Granulosicoccus antarcticus IMCC3135 TaxID=1192854 RepID=A0A2Z2P2V7_9GAMM|nr:M20 aminoacylase family protein [Granulosicoccus antarcticus]ASJ75710.1 putative hydrolase YxeP [Granulosicoccus antarcticus IMCC3135]